MEELNFLCFEGINFWSSILMLVLKDHLNGFDFFPIFHLTHLSNKCCAHLNRYAIFVKALKKVKAFRMVVKSSLNRIKL